MLGKLGLLGMPVSPPDHHTTHSALLVVSNDDHGFRRVPLVVRDAASRTRWKYTTDAQGGEAELQLADASVSEPACSANECLWNSLTACIEPALIAPTSCGSASAHWIQLVAVERSGLERRLHSRPTAHYALGLARLVEH